MVDGDDGTDEGKWRDQLAYEETRDDDEGGRSRSSERVQEHRQRHAHTRPHFMQNERQLHFGLGDTARIDKVVVRWPSGRTEEIPTPAPDRVHKVKEPV